MEDKDPESLRWQFVETTNLLLKAVDTLHARCNAPSAPSTSHLRVGSSGSSNLGASKE